MLLLLIFTKQPLLLSFQLINPWLRHQGYCFSNHLQHQVTRILKLYHMKSLCLEHMVLLQ
jgi:hypothetical protein